MQLLNYTLRMTMSSINDDGISTSLNQSLGTI